MRTYSWIKKPVRATFIERSNRFTAIVELKGEKEKVYLPDPGRLEELLVPGVEVILEKRRNNGRTKYDLLLVETQAYPTGDPLLVSVDSRLPNLLFHWLVHKGMLSYFGRIQFIKAEPPVQNGRLDYYVESDSGKHYIELKSVNLIDAEGTARFPDAPTKRGTKHIRELINLKKREYHSWIFFMVVRKDALKFSPFFEMDPELSETLKEASKKGVQIKALQFSPGIEVEFCGELRVELKKSTFPGFWP
ncbi:DNA/RNA nuclease SfsA [Kosmotoga pacifica]|nr:DNA/RNA nuclease SfsA [Kosmotoga pacifica]